MAISSYATIFTTGATDIIGEVTSISFGGISAAEIDVTTLADTTKTYVLGTTDGGTVEVTCNMISGTAPVLPTSGDATPTSFVLRFGSATTGHPTATFTAYISNVTFEASVDQQVTATYTLRLTGPITMGTFAAS